MFWIKNKKNRSTPANPVFLYKVGFKGVHISRTCFPDATPMLLHNRSGNSRYTYQEDSSVQIYLQSESVREKTNNLGSTRSNTNRIVQP